MIELIFRKKSKGVQSEQKSCFVPLEMLWPNGKPLSKPKLEYLKFPIPADVKQFYKNIHSNLNVVDDIDGFNVENLDFDVEL